MGLPVHSTEFSWKPSLYVNIQACVVYANHILRASDSVVFLRHCTLYKFIYLFTYLNIIIFISVRRKWKRL